ncbi:MAG: hypothetical protein IKQ24_01295 [Verrucomicrobia bacterium]|nr:hypothetical protein [Lachnospiraceae bacterium]MBR4248770.1 hypothetical protein [Verrucomicrobiota bacterium]
MIALKRTRFVLIAFLFMIAVRAIVFFLFGETAVDSILLMLSSGCLVVLIPALIYDWVKARS